MYGPHNCMYGPHNYMYEPHNYMYGPHNIYETLRNNPRVLFTVQRGNFIQSLQVFGSFH